MEFNTYGAARGTDVFVVLYVATHKTPSDEYANAGHVQAVFDSYEEAESFILNYGYGPTESDMVWTYTIVQFCPIPAPFGSIGIPSPEDAEIARLEAAQRHALHRFGKAVTVPGSTCIYARCTLPRFHLSRHRDENGNEFD